MACFSLVLQDKNFYHLTTFGIIVGLQALASNGNAIIAIFLEPWSKVSKSLKNLYYVAVVIQVTAIGSIILWKVPSLRVPIPIVTFMVLTPLLLKLIGYLWKESSENISDKKEEEEFVQIKSQRQSMKILDKALENEASIDWDLVNDILMTLDGCKEQYEQVWYNSTFLCF